MIIASLVVNYDGNGESTVSLEYAANFLVLSASERLEILSDAIDVVSTAYDATEEESFLEDSEEDEEEVEADEESEDEE